MEAGPRFRLGRRAAFACLLLLTLLCGVVRFRAIDRGLPHLGDPDAAIVGRAMALELPPGTPYTDNIYPSTLYPFLLSGILSVVPGTNLTRAAPKGASLREHLAAASAPHVRGRTLVALLSLLAIPATYRLARTWFERSWSIAAAALMATCAQFLDLSLKAKPHAALAALTAVALVACVRLVSSSRARDHALAGISTALAVACLHSGAFVVPALIVASCLGARRDGRWRERSAGLALAGVCIALALVLAYPYMMPWAEKAPDGETTLDMGLVSIRWETWDSTGFGKMAPSLWLWDPWLVVGALCGTALLIGLTAFDAAARRGPRAAAAVVVVTHALCTIVPFGLQAQFYPRFLLPLMPTCAVLSVFAVRAGALGAVRLVGERARPFVTAVVGATLLFAPLWRGVRHALSVARDDTRKQVAQWIEANVPRDDVVLVAQQAALPLRDEDDEVRRLPGWTRSPWQWYELDFLLRDESIPRRKIRSAFAPGVLRDNRVDMDEALARLDETGARWVVTAEVGEANAARDQLENAVRARGGQPVAEFDPERDGERVRPGDVLVVWKLP